MTAQLAITACFTTLPYISGGVKLFMQETPALWILLMILAFIIEIAIICKKDLARTVPTNYILLGSFTLCEAYCVACITTLYDPEIVVTAAFMTAGVVAGLTIYAWTTKEDFTLMRGIFSVLFTAVFMLGIMMMMF